MKSDSTTTVASIAEVLESWAPANSALSYDNVGLQVGRPNQIVERGLVALDATPEVVQEAQRFDASLLITHHPLLFKPLSSLTPHSYASSIALSLAEAGISLYSIHTNLDVAKNGVSFALAELLGLTDVAFLSPTEDTLRKLVTFVPAEHADPIRRAMASAGAGHIGEYDACAFTTNGTGFFRPGEKSKPYIGEKDGDIQSASEVRIEVEVEKWLLGDVLQALHSSHPYEEVAYDVYSLEQTATQTGLGAIGTLANPIPLDAFLHRTAERLDAESLRYAGSLDDKIQRVAVCGGAGSDLRTEARSAGAEVFVTSDVRYHEFFDVFDTAGESSMVLIDAGHYETEMHTEKILRNRLEERFQRVEWRITDHRTGPMHTYVPRDT